LAGCIYNSKLPLTAVHVLNNDVLPHFEQQSLRIETLLSDNGREYCGRPDQHPFELFLQLEGIKYRTTRVRRLQRNGFVERLHRTLLDEHFRIAGRTTWYESIDQMHGDFDAYLHHYN
ncbi:DDE-type integrase/transposase/recombinase, partial [Achromobacter sp. Marseille-Q0513]